MTVLCQVLMGEMHRAKNGRGKNMQYHKLGYSFERNGGSGRSDALRNGPDEVLNFRDMFLFGCTV